MSAADYVIDILLIGIVVLQMRPRPQNWRSLLRPLVLVAIAAAHYLRAIDLAGNDLILIVLLTSIGIVLGASSGRATRLWTNSDGTVLAQAGLFAACLWIAGMGFRLAFAVYADTGTGGASVAQFSVRHDVTSAHVWTTALVLMALGEVLARVGCLQWRARRARNVGRHGLAATPPPRAVTHTSPPRATGLAESEPGWTTRSRSGKVRCDRSRARPGQERSHAEHQC